MLLTAGCSFVWGDELEGFDKNPPTHQKLTWTHLLAERLGMDYINMGICGSCNDRIFRHVTDYLHNPENEKPSLVIVIWSAWQRKELVEHMAPNREWAMGVNRPENATQYSPVRTKVLASRRTREILDEYYTTTYDSRTDIMHGLTQMKAVELICDSLGIPVIQGVFHSRCWANVLSVLKGKGAHDDGEAVEHKFLGETPEYARWVKDALGSLRSTSRLGLGRGPSLYQIGKKIDDIKEFGHPGERTQELWAELMENTYKDMIS